MAITMPVPVCKPAHSVRCYTDDCWKVVTFRGGGIESVGAYHDRAPEPPPDGKFRQAFARARSAVLEIALCNPWEYFATFTLDESKHDRFDLYRFLDDFSQWVRDERKRTGVDIKFLIVPERHVKGGVHAHGLLSGIDAAFLRRFGSFTEPVPTSLLNADRQFGCYSWEPYRLRFGYCSCSPVRDVIASAFYISKYLSKTFDERSGDFGKHLYRASRGLKRSEKVAEAYVYDSRLDVLCVHGGDFCKTGFVTPLQSSDRLRVDWAFPYQFDTLEMLNEIGLWPEQLEPADVPQDADVDAMCEQLEHYEQMILEGCGYDT